MNFYEEPQLPQECADRKYWSKRFNFASWLFLFIGLYAIFFSENNHAAFYAIGVSIFWRILDVVCDIRHMAWHIKENGDNNASNHG